MRYIARIWLDVEFEAESHQEANRIANKCIIDVGNTRDGDVVEYYDSQVADIRVPEFQGKLND